MRLQRRWYAGLSIAAVAAALVACAHKAVTPMGSDDPCKGVTDWNQAMIPLGQSVKWYESHQKGCIKAIADKQTISTSVGNGQPVTVPGEGACGNTTIVVSAYEGAGAIGSDQYGDGTGKNRGFVVAMIKNTGGCTMGDAFPLPSGQTVYWVIDKLSQSEGAAWHSHFVYADGSYLGGKTDWGIAGCGHTNGNSNYAEFGTGNLCNDGDRNAKSSGPRGPTDGPGYWISCGADCCISNDF